MLVRDVPAKWLSQRKQKPRVINSLNETCSIRIEVGPLISEKVTQLIIHEFVIFLRYFLEGLKDDCYEKLHENH